VLNYRRDGSTCWIDLKVAPLADPTGWHTHALAERLYAGAPIA
jgi:hypothetical protein